MSLGWLVQGLVGSGGSHGHWGWEKVAGFFGEFWNVEVGDVNLDVPCFVW